MDVALGIFEEFKGIGAKSTRDVTETLPKKREGEEREERNSKSPEGSKSWTASARSKATTGNVIGFAGYKRSVYRLVIFWSDLSV